MKVSAFAQVGLPHLSGRLRAASRFVGRHAMAAGRSARSSRGVSGLPRWPDARGPFGLRRSGLHRARAGELRHERQSEPDGLGAGLRHRERRARCRHLSRRTIARQVTGAGARRRRVRGDRHRQRRSVGGRVPGRAALRRVPQQRHSANRAAAALRRKPRVDPARLAGGQAVCVERHVLAAALGQHLAAPAATPTSAGLADGHWQPWRRCKSRSTATSASTI